MTVPSDAPADVGRLRELKDLLTRILGHVSLLEDRLPAARELPELRTLRRDAHRASQLVGTLLPAAAESSGPATGEAAPSSTEPADPAQESILLVEDEDTVRRVTGRLLEKLGYRVTLAADAEEALGIFRARGEEIDLVLTDVVMPGLTGIQMVERLRTTVPDLKVLFTSGYTSRELGQGAGEPPEPFLPKPFSLQDLASKIREVLEAPR